MSGTSLSAARILLIIGGGVAAYKALDLIRRLRERGAKVRVIMTRAAKQFVTPLSAASLSSEKVYDDLIARMANGLADDLATTALLATDKKTLLAPAMNLRMWLHPATQRNVATLQKDGALFVGPTEGEMACGEFGPGRMAEPLDIVAAVEAALAEPTTLPLPPVARAPRDEKPLAGTHVLITSGPTHEPIDPVRFIANRSSGRQGHAIAAAAAAAGARVTLVSGPVAIPDPPGVAAIHVESAREMLEAVEKALPADIFVAAAAVADWRVAEIGANKLKKGSSGGPSLKLVENPDILASVAQSPSRRPAVVVGFAAETENVLAHARDKLLKKKCDLIVANDVGEGTGVFGGRTNLVHLVSKDGVESWPSLDKSEVAARLVERLAAMRDAAK